jgi:catechol 2,3-dioxygenase-like lactoylglutathione lyase family enzyme
MSAMEQIAPIEAGIVVADLERMLRFYVDVLSCSEVRRADIPAELSRAIRVATDGYVNVWLKTPNGEIIKLVGPLVPPTRHSAAAFSAERTGIAYLTFYCRDLEGVLETALAQGAVLRSDPSTRSGSIGLKLVFFEDPEGNVIELVEPANPPGG